MDWMKTGNRPGPAATQNAAAPTNASRGRGNGSKGMRIASVGLLFAATILVVSLVAYMAVGSSNSSADKYVDGKKYQAVFLNGGQVYFGKITNQNDKYMQVKDIYYLRVNQQVQPNQTTSNSSNDISLVKLGCELHGPQDSMVINQSQVIFWENLKDDGQVVKAIAEYVKQNPDGQKCEAQASTSNATGTSEAAGTGAATGTTTKPTTSR